MIGTNIKGFRHLIRMAKTLKEVTFFFKHDHFALGCGIAVYMDWEKYKNPFMSISGDYVIIFNECYDNCKHDNLRYLEKTDMYGRLNELFNRFYHMWVVPVGKRNFRDDSSYIHDIVMMPENFDKLYSDFCAANKKQMPNVTKYANAECSLFKYIFAISSGSKNFFFWAINAYFKNRINIYQIEKILKWNDKYNQLQSKLRKGTITAYTSGSDFFGIVREMALLRKNKRASDVINSFNTAQKKLLKSATLSDRDYETLSKFGKLSPKKKSNFIRKMSTVEDTAEILRQMSFLADIHFEWNKESFMDYYKNLENFNCELILEKGDIVLLKVNDYEAVKRLAKATNWCISKDKKYWNEYVEMNPEATQYVLFDFSKKEDDNLSIVGFTTVHDRGITHAHDFQNRNIMGSRISKTVSEIKSFVIQHMDCNNIYGILDRDGINLSDVISYEPSHYEWNREAMFEYLNKCISPEDYYIIHDEGSKVAFIAEDDNIKYFLGDAYMDNRPGGHNRGDQHIVFADFNKKPTDPERIVFGVIHHNFSTHESTCSRLFNDRFEQITQSFDSKLEEYGLPYDTICRTENVVDRFYSAFAGFEVSIVKDLIKSAEVRKDLKTLNRAGLLRETLMSVAFNYASADYLNLIYDNGYTLAELIGQSYASDFARRLLNTMCDYRNVPDVPSAKDIEQFKMQSLNNYGYSMYIGYFLMLMDIIEKEDVNITNNLLASILERGRRTDLFDMVVTMICNKADLAKNNITNIGKFIMNYAFGNNSPSVLSSLAEKKLSDKLKNYLEGFTARGYSMKSTEIWVKRDANTYVLQGTDKEAEVAHAPRRR